MKKTQARPRATGKKAPQPPPERKPLNRDRILDAALAVIERDGLDAFSTRRLGLELECEAMSIYHYFANKVDLLDAAGNHLLDKLELPDDEGDDRDRVIQVAGRYREIALTHPAGFPLLATRRLDAEHGRAFYQSLHGALDDAGFEPHDLDRALLLVGSWLNGALLQEIATAPDEARFKLDLATILDAVWIDPLRGGVKKKKKKRR